MQYLGGKTRLAKEIARIIGPVAQGRRFVDAFCGGLSVTVAMAPYAGSRAANDGCVPLIALYRAWAEGWRPEPITEEQYAEIRGRRDENDPMTAFAGFGLSYAGKYFGGFARSKKGQDYHATSSRSLGRKIAACGDVLFSCGDYERLDVGGADVVYADPPYRGTTGYGYFRSFDYARFQRRLAAWAATGAAVFVSEYTAPTPGAVRIWRDPRPRSDQLAKAGRIESLFLIPA